MNIHSRWILIEFCRLVVECRQINAMANRATGKGYENETFYTNIKFQFWGIDNIHVMRASLQKLVEGSSLLWMYCVCVGCVSLVTCGILQQRWHSPLHICLSVVYKRKIESCMQCFVTPCLSGSSSLLSFGCGQVAWLNSAVVWQLISDLVRVHYLNVNHIIIVELVDVPRGTAGCTQGDQSPGNMEHLEKSGKSKVVKGKWKFGKRLDKLKWVANIRYCIVFIQSNFYFENFFLSSWCVSFNVSPCSCYSHSAWNDQILIA